MHLSELYQVTSSLKPDSANNTQPKMKMNIPKFSDLSSSFLPNDDDGFVELLWENGQVVMHSNRPNKNYNANTNTTFSLFPKIPSFGSVDPLIEHDEESVPWINCPIDDSLCSELLSDHFENPSPNKPVLKRAVPVINLKNTELITQQQDMPPFPNKENNGSTSGTLNFSHFTRPVAKAGLHNDQERLNNEKASTSYNNNPLESTLIQSSGNYETISIPSSLPTMIEQPTYKKQVLVSNKPEKLEKLKEKSKGVGPVVASSSVCSGNVELKHGLKRKSLEKEDSCLRDSEDIDESVELKRRNSSKAAGIKRSRTAEVHNLSERRRRDRINEKMRALQELIPNCNKVDKASMLDEAIEYLKSLQLQVQMMASGAGFCMPHMMFPPGIHPMRLPIPVHMPPPFHHIGMGMGSGMGIPDLNGYPSVPPQIMHGGRNVLNTALPMFGFPPPVVVASNKENVGESSSHIESASQRENAQVESG